MTPSQNKRIFLSPPHMGGSELDYVRAAFDSNFIAPVGPQLTAFETQFQELTGFRHCVAVHCGTSAIHLALHASGVQPGDVVVASTLTFIGSVSPITFLGAEVIFIDSDQATWNMDLDLLAEEIERLIKDGRKPKAVLPTELYGQPCDIDKLQAICEPHGIPVIVDCAESLGGRWRDQAVGKGARAAAFSFNGNKVITTSGGGILASDDKNLVDYARHLATQARQPAAHYEHQEIGYNYRMSNLLAAVGLGQLEVLEQRVQQKRSIFEFYRERLANLPGVEWMPEIDGGYSNRWLSVALVDEERLGASSRDLCQRLEEENIEARPVWKPMHMQPVFQDCRVVGGSVSESLYQQGICLPSGTAMEPADLERICHIIESVPQKATKRSP